MDIDLDNKGFERLGVSSFQTKIDRKLPQRKCVTVDNNEKVVMSRSGVTRFGIRWAK